MAGKADPVEAESEAAAAVDKAALRQAKGAHTGGSGGVSSTRYVASISWLTVWRSALNQRRHPAACTHRSRNQPFGLSRMKRYSPHAASSVVVGSRGRTMCAGPPLRNSVSSPAPHHGQRINSTSVRYPGGAMLIDQRAAREALERERPRERVRLAFRDVPG